MNQWHHHWCLVFYCILPCWVACAKVDNQGLHEGRFYASYLSPWCNSRTQSTQPFSHHNSITNLNLSCFCWSQSRIVGWIDASYSINLSFSLYGGKGKQKDCSEPVGISVGNALKSFDESNGGSYKVLNNSEQLQQHTVHQVLDEED
jgi:hypothetical protein